MKLILQILLIFLVVSTIFVCVKKPNMHKTVFVYDSAYKIVETPENNLGSELNKSRIEEVVIAEQPKQSFKKTETVIIPDKVEQKTVKSTNSSKTNNVQKVSVKTVNAGQKTISKDSKTTQTIVNKVEKQNPLKKEIVTDNRTNVKTNTNIVQNTSLKEIKQLTEKEEEIAWNVWRSNLQNKIMQDTKLPILPNGVVFRFSFTVDKYGKVSNVQTWSENSNYTPYAIQYIAPVIRGYQGKSILDFPSGSSRTITDVKGGWRISNTQKYSTPQDYNDVEKVKK